MCLYIYKFIVEYCFTPWLIHDEGIYSINITKKQDTPLIWTTPQFCTKILTHGREDGLNPITLGAVTLSIGR